MTRFQLQNNNLIINNRRLNAKHRTESHQIKLPAKLMRQIQIWILRRRDREKLLAMPDHLLKDIGLTREQVVNEFNIPFWKSGIV